MEFSSQGQGNSLYGQPASYHPVQYPTQPGSMQPSIQKNYGSYFQGSQPLPFHSWGKGSPVSQPRQPTYPVQYQIQPGSMQPSIPKSHGPYFQDPQLLPFHSCGNGSPVSQPGQSTHLPESSGYGLQGPATMARQDHPSQYLQPQSQPQDLSNKMQSMHLPTNIQIGQGQSDIQQQHIHEQGSLNTQQTCIYDRKWQLSEPRVLQMISESGSFSGETSFGTEHSCDIYTSDADNSKYLVCDQAKLAQLEGYTPPRKEDSMPLKLQQCYDNKLKVISKTPVDNTEPLQEQCHAKQPDLHIAQGQVVTVQPPLDLLDRRPRVPTEMEDETEDTTVSHESDGNAQSNETQQTDCVESKDERQHDVPAPNEDSNYEEGRQLTQNESADDDSRLQREPIAGHLPPEEKNMNKQSEEHSTCINQYTHQYADEMERIKEKKNKGLPMTLTSTDDMPLDFSGGFSDDLYSLEHDKESVC